MWMSVQMGIRDSVKVECVNNGREAVDQVLNSEAGYYDLVLMDIQMPIMNGYEATQAIRLSLIHI